MVWVDPKEEPGDRDGGLFKGVFVGKNVVCFQPGLGLVFQIRERFLLEMRHVIQWRLPSPFFDVTE